MSGSSICIVEFIGGPADGHQQPFILPLDPFLGVRTLSIPLLADNRGGMIAGLARVWRSEPKERIPLAIYELQWRGPQHACYRYLRSCAVTSEELRDGCGLNQIVEHLRESSS